jgi:hypothetical protein
MLVAILQAMAEKLRPRRGGGQAMNKLYVCPVCGNVTTAEAEEINCGDCLMERVEVVRLRLVEVMPQTVRASATDCPMMVPDLSNVVLFRRRRP